MMFATRHLNNLFNALNSFNAAGFVRPETGLNTAISANNGTDTGAHRRVLLTET